MTPETNDTDDYDAPDNWQARLGAAIAQLDAAISTGQKQPALRAIEICNQLIAECVINKAARKD